MKTLTLVSLACLALCHALPLTIRQDDLSTLETITDTLLFDDTMDQFQAARNAEQPPELNWYSNGCSDSPDKPLGYNFLPSCQRHDFGYHNYKAQGRFAEGKDAIDSNFKADMYNECDTHGPLSSAACKGVADVYYEAVHVFGGLSGSGKMA